MTADDDGQTCAACGAAVPGGRSVCPACGRLQRRAPAAADRQATPDPGDLPPPPTPGVPAPPRGFAGPGPSSVPPRGFAGPGPVPGPTPSGGWGGPPGGTAGPVRSGGWAPSGPAEGVLARHRRARRRRRLVTLLVVGAVLCGGVGLVLAERSRNDARTRRERAADEAALERAANTTTTTAVRIRDTSLLDSYCARPATAWPEVPAHVPGEPSRTWVVRVDGVSGGAVPSESGPTVGTASELGSTVLSPRTDGLLTRDPAALDRTRSVTCLTFDGTVGTGTPCPYERELYPGLGTNGGGGGTFELELARSRWKLVVYELHGGTVLHQGEIQSQAPGCPDQVRVDEGSTQVWFPLTDGDVGGWFAAHFTEGRPS